MNQKVKRLEYMQDSRKQSLNQIICLDLIIGCFEVTAKNNMYFDLPERMQRIEIIHIQSPKFSVARFS